VVGGSSPSARAPPASTQQRLTKAGAGVDAGAAYLRLGGGM
jgi:hypothetical protein